MRRVATDGINKTITENIASNFTKFICVLLLFGHRNSGLPHVDSHSAIAGSTSAHHMRHNILGGSRRAPEPRETGCAEH
jgi:hypothetical protein